MSGIMLVDNVAFERITMKDIIAQAGYEVTAEVNIGEDVIKTFERVNPDLTIMDIDLPDNDGMDVLKKLLKAHKNAKVCICTAMAQQAVIIESIQLGVKDFIVKPYNTERLRESIAKILG